MILAPPDVPRHRAVAGQTGALSGRGVERASGRESRLSSSMPLYIMIRL
jgi:hypothetical protein